LLAKLLRLLGIPYVVQVHGANFNNFWKGTPQSIHRSIARFFENSGCVILLGEQIAADFIDENPRLAPLIRVIYNASRPVPSSVRRQPENVRILFLGRIGTRKGVPQLIEALQMLDDLPGWDALIAGDGGVKESLTAVAARKLQHRVSVCGWLDQSAVEEALSGSSILALPSFEEALPMAIVEAFAHGLAVVATPVGAIAEIVKHRETGLLVEPGDVTGLALALTELLSDPELLQRLGRQARAFHAMHLDIDRQSSELVAIWKRLATAREDALNVSARQHR
jgi:glycosyltransferase involved in cell wall biosynthesis